MMSILLADHHDVVRRELRELVAGRPEWKIVGEASDGREAVSLAIKLKPNVVVIALMLPQLNGLDATREIRKEVPETEVLVLAKFDSPQFVRDLLAAGARGYALMFDTGEQLLEAIEKVGEHKQYLSRNIASAS
jgi:DNA-binding NarL/FixJ family response regulator